MACIVVYGVVVALYALNAQTIRTDGCTEDIPPGHARISFAPQSVDAVGDRLVATIDVQSFGPVGEDSVPSEPITMVLTGTDGARIYTFESGTVAAPISVRFITEGNVEAWPFDTHTAEMGVALVTGAATDSPDVVKVQVCGIAHVPGWYFSSTQEPGNGHLVIGGESQNVLKIVAHRSAATIAFGIVLLALMVVLPVLGITVAVTVLRGRRKVEATLTSWMAAMLFAVVPLRGFLPGSPPVGSWVDYLVVLWVVAGLVAGLVVYVIAWLRWAPPGAASE